MPPESTTRPRSDPNARIAVIVLLDIMLFATLHLDIPFLATFHLDIARWLLIPLIVYQFIGHVRYRSSSQLLHDYPRVRLPPSLRFAIMKRDHYRCRICGRKASDRRSLEVDHKVPVARGGTNHPSNLWTLCTTCNSGKSDSLL